MKIIPNRKQPRIGAVYTHCYESESLESSWIITGETDDRWLLQGITIGRNHTSYDFKEEIEKRLISGKTKIIRYENNTK